MKKLLLFVSLTLLFATTIYAKPEILIDETSYDFGDILSTNGKVSHTFIFINTGDEPLEIKKVTSS